jgi:hypothetical protein
MLLAVQAHDDLSRSRYAYASQLSFGGNADCAQRGFSWPCDRPRGTTAYPSAAGAARYSSRMAACGLERACHPRPELCASISSLAIPHGVPASCAACRRSHSTTAQQGGSSAAARRCPGEDRSSSCFPQLAAFGLIDSDIGPADDKVLAQLEAVLAGLPPHSCTFAVKDCGLWKESLEAESGGMKHLLQWLSRCATCKSNLCLYMTHPVVEDRGPYEDAYTVPITSKIPRDGVHSVIQVTWDKPRCDDDDAYM